MNQITLHVDPEQQSQQTFMHNCLKAAGYDKHVAIQMFITAWPVCATLGEQAASLAHIVYQDTMESLPDGQNTSALRNEVLFALRTALHETQKVGKEHHNWSPFLSVVEKAIKVTGLDKDVPVTNNLNMFMDPNAIKEKLNAITAQSATNTKPGDATITTPEA